jgi:tetratricopeptide (TPR) repeat protein
LTMRAGTRFLACALAPLCAIAVTAEAHAQPSVWDLARDGKTARAHHTLIAVERMLERADRAFDPMLSRNFTRAGLAMLELAGGDELPDPRVRFLLADLLIDASLGREEQAVEILERALEQAPDSPLAGRAWFNLAIASAKLGHPERERLAYTRALEVVWGPRFRANIYMNRGESNMVLGDLEQALKDYREAIRLAAGPDHQALAHYGLGIALERSGDLPAALDAMRIAESIRGALDFPGVFFVPAYDLHYYRALGAMAGAKFAPDDKTRLGELERAAIEWQAYLLDAEPDNHRWVLNARLHLSAVERELRRVALEARKGHTQRAGKELGLARGRR